MIGTGTQGCDGMFFEKASSSLTQFQINILIRANSVSMHNTSVWKRYALTVKTKDCI